MASNQTSLAMSSSPESSDGIHSDHDSPETRVTVFSPDDVRSSTMVAVQGANGTAKPPPGFTLEGPRYQLPEFLDSASSVHSSDFSFDGNGHLATVGALPDPFIAETDSKHPGSTEQKLSATATSFTPSHGPGNGTSQSDHAGTSTSNMAGLHSPESASPVTSSTTHGDVDPHAANHTTCVANGSTPYASSSQANPASGSETRAGPMAVKTLGPTEYGNRITIVRSLAIQANDQHGGISQARMLKNLGDIGITYGLRHGTLIDMTIPGKIILGFSDPSECEAVFQALRLLDPRIKIDHVNPEYLMQKYDPNRSVPKPRASIVYVKVDIESVTGAVDVETLGKSLPELLNRYGNITECQMLGPQRRELLCVITGFRDKIHSSLIGNSAEYYSFEGGRIRLVQVKYLDDAAFSSLLDHVVDDATTRHILPRLGPAPRGVRFVHGLGMPRGRCADAVNGNEQPRLNHTDVGVPSLMPFHAALTYGIPPQHSPATFSDQHGTIGQERSEPPQAQSHHGRNSQHRGSSSGFGSRRGTNYSSAPHNIVDVDRITRGLDVRTTIMLRNIPNKIDQPMLKEIVDETSLGKYDFMYLRIDFANNCNVGYAFINFEDPYFIIDFVNARAGFRWNRFNSDKVAEVSYATIQGKDCLIQKFRNSSVMLELPWFRPKVFFTGTGPLAGTEDVFPGPDNSSKMRRSVENAAHVGLFSPGGGQNPRYDQRRRRSQYDRGTPLAQMEEAYAFSSPDFPNHLGYPGQPGLPGNHGHTGNPRLLGYPEELNTTEDNHGERHVDQDQLPVPGFHGHGPHVNFQDRH